MLSPPILKLTEPSPSAQTRITAATMRFLLFVKSTLFSTTFRTPIAEIIPYSMKDTPPITAVGIRFTTAANFGENDSSIAITAAILITCLLYTSRCV